MDNDIDYTCIDILESLQNIDKTQNMFKTYQNVSYGNSFSGDATDNYIDYNGQVINQKNRKQKNEIIFQDIQQICDLVGDGKLLQGKSLAVKNGQISRIQVLKDEYLGTSSHLDFFIQADIIIKDLDPARNGFVTNQELEDLFKMIYPVELKNVNLKKVFQQFASIQNKLLIDYKKLRQFLQVSAAKFRYKTQKGGNFNLEFDKNTLLTKDDIRRERLFQSKGVSQVFNYHDPENKLQTIQNQLWNQNYKVIKNQKSQNILPQFNQSLERAGFKKKLTKQIDKRNLIETDGQDWEIYHSKKKLFIDNQDEQSLRRQKLKLLITQELTNKKLKTQTISLEDESKNKKLADKIPKHYYLLTNQIYNDSLRDYQKEKINQNKININSTQNNQSKNEKNDKFYKIQQKLKENQSQEQIKILPNKLIQNMTVKEENSLTKSNSQNFYEDINQKSSFIQGKIKTAYEDGFLWNAQNSSRPKTNFNPYRQKLNKFVEKRIESVDKNTRNQAQLFAQKTGSLNFEKQSANYTALGFSNE